MYLFVWQSLENHNLCFEIKEKSIEGSLKKIHDLGYPGPEEEKSNRLRLIHVTENFDCPRCTPPDATECNFNE